MGSHSYADTCPKCGSEMDCNSETRSPMVSGECLECGYTYWTQEGQMPLQEVNEVREDRELKILKELKKQYD